MPKVVLRITNGALKLSVGATQPADWDTITTAFQAQTVNGAFTVTELSNTADATFSEPETDTVSPGKWALEIEGFQDWTEATGISKFLYDNETLVGWARVVIPTGTTGDKVSKAVAPVQYRVGSFGGKANEPLKFTVSLPCQARPTITQHTLPIVD